MDKWFRNSLLVLILLTLFFTGCNLYSEPTPEGTLKVHFIDVGQGDSILIQEKDYVMLIDGGDRSAGEKVAQYLKELGIQRINTVVGTHPHADHIGGLIQVLENFTVDEVIDPGVIHTTKTFEDYLTIIDQKNIKFTEGRAGMRVDVKNGFYFKILHPSNPSSRELNNASIVIKLVYGDINFLFTGDIEREAELEILDSVSRQTLKSQVLKVAHHGSSTSTTREFLQMVSPQIGIIMVGEGNRYGHPHEETLDLLREKNITVYRTDLHGTIIITTDGNTYSLKTEK
ncbi:ComEC/Rec2 family competence protein [Anaerobranca gottschalkii]|uniref:Metallo-beta-lactamase superfamily protein n=1 Tax=Anaerobranca gottschalkii DSM 13577 TaxID=1120990 RepID=A0A1I0AT00_9FIRM|nr:ComEC/Rec2 family competence protein [Anaerobranca gottschalkii]SES97531.1 Metallo-beta-lactamase superfamily protein [Anaerobranca gottschalkii DSM 13577]